MYSGIIASVITFDHFKSFVNHPGKYDSLSGAVVSTFTGMSFPFFCRPSLHPDTISGGCFFGTALAGW